MCLVRLYPFLLALQMLGSLSSADMISLKPSATSVLRRQMENRAGPSRPPSHEYGAYLGGYQKAPLMANGRIDATLEAIEQDPVGGAIESTREAKLNSYKDVLHFTGLPVYKVGREPIAVLQQALKDYGGFVYRYSSEPYFPPHLVQLNNEGKISYPAILVEERRQLNRILRTREAMIHRQLNQDVVRIMFGPPIQTHLDRVLASQANEQEEEDIAVPKVRSSEGDTLGRLRNALEKKGRVRFFDEPRLQFWDLELDAFGAVTAVGKYRYSHEQFFPFEDVARHLRPRGL